MSYDITLTTVLEHETVRHIAAELAVAASELNCGCRADAEARIASLGDVNAALRPCDVAYWDPTYNYAAMFTAAFGHSIRDFSGKRASAMGAGLRSAIVAMQADPTKFKAFDAPNGWGTYDDLIPLLETMRDTCEAYPNAMVSVQ